MYCQFGDKCQYAHGRFELREKPTPVPPSELPEQVKIRLAEKAKSMPGYKTKICSNYGEGQCQYREMCHYAHGETELRQFTDQDKQMADQMKVKTNPFYKTIMCKNLQDCQYGEQCVYAHSPSEIRDLASNVKVGGPSAEAMLANVRGGYKTALCKNYMENKSCTFGEKCTFAHGNSELRTQPAMNGAMMVTPPAMNNTL